MATNDAALLELRNQLSALQLQVNAKRTPVATSSGGLPESRHLDGRNYTEWKFVMKNFLVDAGLWCCVEAVEGTVVDPDLDQRALAKINLSVKSIAAAETKKAKTAKEAWSLLQKTYEDSGVIRRIGLYSSLFKTRYETCDSMSAYIDTITSIADQLTAIGKPLDDETVGGIILGGLPENYRPLILGIQGSNQSTSVDFVKNLLLQENVKDMRAETAKSSDSAFYGKSNFPRRPKPKNRENSKPRCYNCNEYGHIRDTCPKTHKETQKPKDGKKNFNSFFAGFDDKKQINSWFLDSGSNNHMTPRSDWMQDFHPEEYRSINVANGHSIPAKGTGTVNIPLATGEVRFAEHVVLAPDLSTNLLSVSQIAHKGNSVIFDEKGCTVTKAKIKIAPKDVICTATEENGLYRLNTQELQSSAAVITTKNLWHRRLAHLNHGSMHLLKSMSTGYDPGSGTSTPCDPCVRGKQSRKPFSKEATHRAKDILDLVHTDLCGPMETTSIGGSKYFLTFTDDFSRKSFIYFLKTKDEVTQIFKEFVTLMENQMGKRVKILRSDNGGEYISNALRKYLKSNGIRHQMTVCYSPEQNGVSERLNRTLCEKARSMLADSGLPTEYWGEAVNTANYLKNRSPTKPVENMTPEEAWSKNKPDLSHLRIFGCKVMVHVPKALRKKWSQKSTEQIFVGYGEDTKGYRVIHPTSKKFTFARDVVFFEDEFIGKKFNAEISTVPPCSPELVQTEPDLRIVNFEMEQAIPLNVIEPERHLHDIDAENDEEHHGERRYPQRERRPPKRLEDYVVYNAEVSTGTDPITVEEALNGPESSKWKTAMEEEYKSHLQNKTWTLVDLPTGRKPINFKWVFKKKFTIDGEVDKYKARLVAKGCSQKQGIDYEETYSPVVRYSSIRFLCALAVKYNFDLDQMDAISAFLQGDLNETVYMKQPTNFVNVGEENKVCKLTKSVYGLKQSGLMWNMKLDGALKDIGLTRSKADSCIYYSIGNGRTLIVAVYVDDLLIVSSHKDDKLLLKKQLMQRFKMKDLGEAKCILGMRINRDRSKGTISLDQQKYVESILARFGMQDSNPVATPLDPNQKLTKDMQPKTDEDQKEMKDIPYQEAIGSIMFCAQTTRPDIAHAVGEVSRFNSNPGKPHWIAVKRILRYLTGTSTWKLEFKQSKDVEISGYCDADWASNVDDRRSVTGYVYLMNGAAITWNSRRQPTVALSTTESEYMALSSAVQEAMWLRVLKSELDTDSKGNVIHIYCDNKGAVDLATTTSCYKPRTKHIDIRHHFVKEKFQEGSLKISQVSTKDMVADLHTKGLFSDKHRWCCMQMGLNVI